MKRKLLVWVVVMVYSITVPLHLLAHVERFYYLKGALGNNELVVKILCYDEVPTRHLYYFFSNDKQDRYLIGRAVRGVWEFKPEAVAGTPSKTSLAIAENKNSTWSGSFTDSLGKETLLTLRPIRPDSITSPFGNLPELSEINPYEHYRLAKVRFKKSNTEIVASGETIQWLTDAETGISFFRLLPLRGTVGTDSINAALTITHLVLLKNFYQCRTAGQVVRPQSTVTYLSKELVSYVLVATLPDSKGIPVTQRQFTTLYRHSGQPVNLEDLLWFGTPGEQPESSDLFKIYKYRNNTFAPMLFSQLQQLYPAKMQMDSCGVNRVENWALPMWGLIPTGFLFTPRNAEQCLVFRWAVLPYDKIKPFLLNYYKLL